MGKRTAQFRQALEQSPRGAQGVSRAFLENMPPPQLSPQTPYGRLVQALVQDGKHYHPPENQALMHLAERLILVLTLAPHVRPEALDVFFYPNAQNRDFTEFGGVKAKTHTGFLPTGETAFVYPEWR
ncbi:MAG: hypothetical protein HC913_11915 [Microscillaceae bacterium]|nr:hypothetical protein [Microscillaceae bacterium]